MKLVVAYIKPHKLPEVSLALHGVAGLPGITVADVRGWGRGKSREEARSHADQVRDFEPHVKIEVLCPRDRVQEVIGAISRAARTGLEGDGKIYVHAVEDAVRISDGERGEGAV